MFKKLKNIYSLRDSAEETNRFIIKEKQYLPGEQVYILVDNVTGVHYIHPCGTYGCGGFFPLLDDNGKVICEKN